MNKERLVKRAQRIMRKQFPNMEGRPGACLYWALATIAALKGREGIRACIQAGSCSWPRLTNEQDDGKETTMTHYSYVFERSSPATIMNLMENKLPEMHVWVAIPETQEIIDLTTPYMIAACEQAGMDWPGDVPPEYLWCKAEEIPDRVIYHPDISAIAIALEYIDQIRLTEKSNRR